MKKSRKLIFVVGILIALVGILSSSIGSRIALAVPADDSASERSRNQIVHTETDTDSDSNTENRTEQSNKKAEKDLLKQRENRAVLSAENRKTVCENRQNAIDNKVRAIGEAASANLIRLEAARDKMDVYLGNNPIEGISIDSLDITQARSNAQASVDEFNKLSGESLKCDDTDPAQWISIVRDSAVKAREALKAYRSELKNTIDSIRQAQNVSENR